MTYNVQLYKMFSTSGPKAGDDKRKEGEEEGGGGGKEGDLDSLVELVGQEDEEHQERHHQETVAQGRVGRGPSVILKRLRITIRNLILTRQNFKLSLERPKRDRRQTEDRFHFGVT